MKITALRLARRQSLPTPKTKGRLAPPLQKQNSASSFVFPNIVDALVAETGDLNEKITAWWWEDPSRNLSADEAVARSGESKVLSQMQDDSNIRETHKDLDKLGFINKELYNPQKTKMEYFWLIIFHFMFSGFALVLEIVNGGTYTKSGLYYSWDVRLGAFMMGIFFLLLYYKKYHPLRDLVSTSPCRPQYFCPIFCCCVKDDPLKSIPEEDVVRAFLAPPPPPTGILSPSGSDKGDGEESKSPEKETREIQTQTSLVSEKSVTSLANRKDGAKMTQQCATVAEEDTAVTRNESNEAAEVELPKIIVKER